MPAAGELLRALVPVLRQFGNRWYVFGAQAVTVWGRPRLTGDIDVTVLLEPEDPTGFVAAMERAGFGSRVPDPEGFARKTRVLPFVHHGTSLPLDIVLGSAGPEEEFARTARRIDLYGTAVPVIAPEELVVTKILAGRAKDLDDVQGVLLAQGDALDLARVRALLTEFETGLGRSDLLPVLDAQLAAVRRSQT